MDKWKLYLKAAMVPRRHLEPLMDDPVDVPTPKALLGDKGYDNDSNREALLLRGILPVIPSKRSRKVVIPHDELSTRIVIASNA